MAIRRPFKVHGLRLGPALRPQGTRRQEVCVHVCPLNVHTFVPSDIDDFWSVTLVAYVYPNTQAEPRTYAYLHAHTVSQTRHLAISLHYIPAIADTQAECTHTHCCCSSPKGMFHTHAHWPCRLRFPINHLLTSAQLSLRNVCPI